jgi:hypothetical protein
MDRPSIAKKYQPMISEVEKFAPESKKEDLKSIKKIL